jgi:hypothetical protein
MAPSDPRREGKGLTTAHTSPLAAHAPRSVTTRRPDVARRGAKGVCALCRCRRRAHSHAHSTKNHKTRPQRLQTHTNAIHHRPHAQMISHSHNVRIIGRRTASIPDARARLHATSLQKPSMSPARQKECAWHSTSNPWLDRRTSRCQAHAELQFQTEDQHALQPPSELVNARLQRNMSHKAAPAAGRSGRTAGGRTTRNCLDA